MIPDSEEVALSQNLLTVIYDIFPLLSCDLLHAENIYLQILILTSSLSTLSRFLEQKTVTHLIRAFLKLTVASANTAFT